MTIRLAEKIAISFFLSVVAIVVVMLFTAGWASANPSSFINSVTTGNTASSTPVFMSPGRATSTVTHNACAQTVSGGLVLKGESVTFLFQFTPSSTNSVINVVPEYSQDGVDWYRNFVFDPSQLSTSTAPIHLTTPFSFLMRGASTTPLGGIATSSDRMTAAFTIPTPTCYMRVFAYITGGNGSFWAHVLPVREQR